MAEVAVTIVAAVVAGKIAAVGAAEVAEGKNSRELQ